MDVTTATEPTAAEYAEAFANLSRFYNHHGRQYAFLTGYLGSAVLKAHYNGLPLGHAVAHVRIHNAYRALADLPVAPATATV